MRYQPQSWSAGCGWPFSGRWPWSPQWERSPPRWSWNERRRRELARQGRTRLLPGLHCFGNERDYSRSDAALGVEYSGITDVTLGAEALYQHLNEFDELPSNSLTASIEREIVQSIFSWQQDFLHSRKDPAPASACGDVPDGRHVHPCVCMWRNPASCSFSRLFSQPTLQ